MDIYEDERWIQIVKELKSVPERNINPLGGTWRIHGYRSYAEMDAAWKANIRFINDPAPRWPDIHKQAIALANEYYDEARLLNNAVSRNQFKTDANQKEHVERMSRERNTLSAAVRSATSVDELRKACGKYADKTSAYAYIYAEALDVYLKWEKANNQKQAAVLSDMKLNSYKARATEELRLLALRSPWIYDASGKPICHMLSVAIDLSDGIWESGRAGHKREGDELEKVFDFKLPTVAASANATENPHNCAELDALYKLKTKKPSVKMTDVFFISMMPGGSKVIPPCVNCQRWIQDQRATASKFDYKKK